MWITWLSFGLEFASKWLSFQLQSTARLIALLESHGIEWRLPPQRVVVAVPEPSRLSTAEKVELFRRLFRGRTDVYPIRWESKSTGKSGYAPACANEWHAGVCEKPRIKCGDCSNRLLIPLSDAVIYDHLAGEHTVGVYPLLEDDTCYFLAVDFDEAEWRDDARSFIQSCEELGVPAALEISRSGNGAHAWVFFGNRVSARDARRLGTAIISHTCSRKPCVCRYGTSPVSSAMRKTTRSTSPCLEVASMPRWICCGTTVSHVTCATSALAEATDDTLVLTHAALKGLEAIFLAGYRYKKTGVLLTLLSDKNSRQSTLFDDQEAREKSTRLMAAIDAINRAYGRDTVHLAVSGTHSSRLFVDVLPSLLMRKQKLFLLLLFPESPSGRRSDSAHLEKHCSGFRGEAPG